MKQKQTQTRKVVVEVQRAEKFRITVSDKEELTDGEIIAAIMDFDPRNGGKVRLCGGREFEVVREKLATNIGRKVRGVKLLAMSFQGEQEN